MSLRDTTEMSALWNKIKPYLDDNIQLPNNVPEDIKLAFSEYIRLSKEQEDFALSL